MLKKKLIASALAMSVLLSGCESRLAPKEYAPNESPIQMTVIDETFNYKIYKHNVTGIYYFCVKYAEGTSVCVMVNADGTPYIG